MIKNQEKIFKRDIAHAKKYGFIFPSSEIYGGLNSIYDYGQNGVELKNNIKKYWWKSMVQLNDNIVGIDSAIFMHPNVWKASQHIDFFNDPLIDNKDSKKRYRVDLLIEDFCTKLKEKNNKLEKVKLLQRMNKSLNNNDFDDIKNIFKELEISDPETGSKNWSEVQNFNLMFKTKFGASSTNTIDLFLRPETAQGAFINFLNVQKTGRIQLPFGIIQIGKVFRNEIIARQFIFRMREFEQMEMQFFIPPEKGFEFYEIWKHKRLSWHYTLGLGKEKYRFHNHEKLAHYANAACDIEFKFSFGFKELEGIHSRTDFDLSSHEQHSGKKIRYFDKKLNKSYIPHVVETSLGLDRLFFAVLSSSLKEEKLQNGSLRTVLSIHPALSSYKAAILPLVKKDRLDELAYKIYSDLKLDYHVIYEEKDSIGKRYRRQDAIGTPFCITIDYDSINNNSVTIRYRDSMMQERISIDKLSQLIDKEVNMKSLLKMI